MREHFKEINSIYRPITNKIASKININFYLKIQIRNSKFETKDAKYSWKKQNKINN